MTNRLLCRFFFWLAGPGPGRWWRPVDVKLFALALWFRVRPSSELSPVRHWWRRAARRPMATHRVWHTEGDYPVGLACSCTLRPSAEVVQAYVKRLYPDAIRHFEEVDDAAS